MERLSFYWTFPGGLQEEGTRVCHYFTGKEKAEATDKPTEAMSGRFDFTGFLKRLFPGISKPTPKLSVEVTVNRKRRAGRPDCRGTDAEERDRAPARGVKVGLVALYC